MAFVGQWYPTRIPNPPVWIALNVSALVIPRVGSVPTPCPFGGIPRRPRSSNTNLTLRGPKWLSRQRLRNRLEELILSPRHSLFLHVLGYHFPPSSHRIISGFLPQCPLSVAQDSFGNSDANGISLSRWRWTTYVLLVTAYQMSLIPTMTRRLHSTTGV